MRDWMTGETYAKSSIDWSFADRVGQAKRKSSKSATFSHYQVSWKLHNFVEKSQRAKSNLMKSSAD